MPAEPSSRRASRKSTVNEEDLEARRSRGEISCAECRRLKLKCDKKIPCSSCIRRGCQSICPTGSLSTGQGTRFVLADTTQLHSKITEMGQRIRQLEDALSIFQSGVSNECHPLLTSDLLAIKFGPENVKDAEAQAEALRSSIDALGTLTIGESGEAKYFGRSAGSETLLFAAAEQHPQFGEVDAPSDMSPDLARLSNAFPFGDTIFESDIFFEMVSGYLPEQLRAWSLCETYYEQYAWSFSPIRRDELIDEYLTPIYKAVKDAQMSVAPLPPSITPHKCAVLFIVFAIGSWVDLTLDNYLRVADRFFHLSRACLSMRSVFDSPEIATVQAISLMSAYHSLEGRQFTMDSAWALMSLACKLAQSLGLHRDSARWNMDARTVDRRRHLFWELYSNEMFYCMGLGRPPSIRLSYIDTEVPADVNVFDAQGQPVLGFYRWKHEFVRELYSELIETTLTAVPPKYEVILELDRRVRERALPIHLNTIYQNGEGAGLSPRIYFQSNILGMYRTVILMYLHRSFFSQALLDHPINPLRSPYAPSFLATYRCASWTIKVLLNSYEHFPKLSTRLFHPWTHLLSAVIIVGSIVTHAPASALADNAFMELELGCNLYEKAMTDTASARIQSGWRVLQKLRGKAHEAYSQHRSGTTEPSKGLSISTPNYGEDELAIFGGQTRLLVSKTLSASARSGIKKSDSYSTPSTDLSPAETPSPPSTNSGDELLNEVHPSLAEYLNTAPLTQFANFETSQNLSSVAAFHTDPAPLSSNPNNQPLNGNNWANANNPFASLTGDTWPQSGPSADNTFLSFMDSSNDPPPSGMNDQWQSFMQQSGLFQ